MALRLASIFSPGASPAAGQARPVAERASTIQRLRCGGRWPESLAYFGPRSSASRTWRTYSLSLLRSLDGHGERFSAIWPRSAMCAHGTVSPLPPSAPRTFATVSSALLPTPVAKRDAATGRGARERGGGIMLTQQTEELLPTPSATPNGHNRSPSEVAAVRPSLPGVVELLPTPMARARSGTEVSGASRTGGPMLAEAIALLPTPVKGDGQGARQATAPNPRDPSPTLSDLEYRWNGDASAGRSNAGPRYTANRPSLSARFAEWMLGAPQGWSDPDCLLSATEFSSRPGTSSESG